jgi:hypothetical protein
MKHSDIKDWRKKWRKNPVVATFTSLRLTIVLLAFSMALVFFGTLDQANIGINKAQKDYFESFFVTWKYPQEWPLGMKMVLVTHPESDLAKNNEKIAIDDKVLKNFRFLGFIDNTFHRQIKSVLDDSDGALEPDSNLRFHSLNELKETLANDNYKNGFAAILPDSAMDKPSTPESRKDKTGDPELAVIPIKGQLPFTLRGFPVPLPGGYLLGGLLLINLLASATFRYQLSWRHAGIWITHGGLALMLVSELVTDLTERESIMVIDEGQSVNYSKDFHLDEFVLIDESDPSADHVLSIPVDRLEPSGNKPADVPTINLELTDKRFPFILTVKDFYRNTDFKSPDEGEKSFEVSKPNNTKVKIAPIVQQETFRADEMNFRSAVVELRATGATEKPIGEWLASSFFDIADYRPQRFEHNGKTYRIEIRRKRYYYDFHIQLLDFRFLRYPGTDRPKDFSSDIKIDMPEEPPRKTRIYMNHPLNLDGNTFFQAGFDSATEKQTRLQVVYNPGSWLPYIGVMLVGKGLTVQFLYHLFTFASRRRKSAMS